MWSQLHQDYLQTLIEWGLVGAILLAVPAWAAFSPSSFRPPANLIPADQATFYCAGLAVVITLLHAGVDFPLQVASLQLYVIAYLAFLWSAPRWRPQ